MKIIICIYICYINVCTYSHPHLHPHDFQQDVSGLQPLWWADKPGGVVSPRRCDWGELWHLEQGNPELHPIWGGALQEPPILALCLRTHILCASLDGLPDSQMWCLNHKNQLFHTNHNFKPLFPKNKPIFFCCCLLLFVICCCLLLFVVVCYLLLFVVICCCLLLFVICCLLFYILLINNFTKSFFISS